MTKEDQVQRERFEQAASELGVELDERKLKDSLRKMTQDVIQQDDEAKLDEEK